MYNSQYGYKSKIDEDRNVGARMKIFILILVILILYLSLKKKEQYSLFLTQYKKELLLPIIAPFSLFIVDKLDIYKRFPKLSGNVHQKMITL